MMNQMIQHQSHRKAKVNDLWFAILPWVELSRPVAPYHRDRANRIANALSRIYSERISSPNDNYFSRIDYNNHLEERCILTRQGLEHIFGYRIKF